MKLFRVLHQAIQPIQLPEMEAGGKYLQKKEDEKKLTFE